MTQPVSIHVLREKYIRFFEAQGHARVPSASLIPDNDPTTLFTGSGMQPMVPYLLGQAHPLGQRLVNSQRCFRAIDIEEVGDSQHTTYFEMLGNWSLGDYFKREQLQWIFSFLTDELGLPAHRLYVTVFRGNQKLQIPQDTEAAEIWQELFARVGVDNAVVDFPEREGLQGGRIFYYDETKNWWSRAGVPNNMPAGEPGGPDSEIFWDFGAAHGLHEASSHRAQPCHVNCDCGRFIEIGNNVFMQYRQTVDGFTKLPRPNVDFGGGLERIAAAVGDNPDVYAIDAFAQARAALETRARQAYDTNPATTHAFRIILDHLRAAVFLLADGVVPANKDQGYFTRRLIRRAVRFGKVLTLSENFCEEIGDAFITTYRDAMPHAQQRRDQIVATLEKEETKFRATLDAGLRVVAKALAAQPAGTALSDSLVFDLYQSYGFPFEMTQELAQEAGHTVNREAFARAFAAHQARSRAGATKKFRGGLADHSEQSIKYHTATHLLHQALRDVLGAQAIQRGSNITPQRLRFDFSHPQKLTREERARVERIVNDKIEADLPVTRQEMAVPEAKALGALGVFEHKYGARVSVYMVGDYSKEICGGPHVERTGILGTFRITDEESAGAGVRRIKAVLE